MTPERKRSRRLSVGLADAEHGVAFVRHETFGFETLLVLARERGYRGLVEDALPVFHVRLEEAAVGL